MTFSNLNIQSHPLNINVSLCQSELLPLLCASQGSSETEHCTVLGLLGSKLVSLIKTIPPSTVPAVDTNQKEYFCPFTLKISE